MFGTRYASESCNQSQLVQGEPPYWTSWNDWEIFLQGIQGIDFEIGFVSGFCRYANKFFVQKRPSTRMDVFYGSIAIIYIYTL